MITDIFAFCTAEVPSWNTISVSGYHIREAGSTALQELAFTLRDGLEYVDWGVRAGLDVDDFVPRIDARALEVAPDLRFVDPTDTRQRHLHPAARGDRQRREAVVRDALVSRSRVRERHPERGDRKPVE